ncbi:hypothetical protein BCV70DRAFT_198795 [Testicularia cyperi]|uniref:Rho-GAP domain-containing protein n=1 Tax=Testicularia cyperi TaxID=1882483 RepID=A0A317XSR0_9BASI|nr:hypothetical protein BCV70DRAFT_198795 [Testicularia cyperi]
MDTISLGLSTTARKSTEYLSRTASSNGHNSDGQINNANDVSEALLDTFRALLAEVDSYITHYESRIKLEEDYLKNLKLSLERQKELDAKVNSRLVGYVGLVADARQYPGLRKTWHEMRENDIREIEARSYMVETCRQAVLMPLLAFRDAQERIRKRVKEDLRISLAQYDEMRGLTLPKIRRNYEKRAEEVDQLQLQAQAVEDQRMLLSTRPTSPEQDGATSTSRSAAINGGSGSAIAIHRRRSSRRHSRRQSASSTKSLGMGGSASARGAESADEKSSSVGSPPTVEVPLPNSAPLTSSSLPSPSQDKAKGTFFDVFKTREGWDTARKEAPKKLGALISRMREGREGSYGVSSPGEGSGSDTILGSLSAANRDPYKATQNIAIKQAKAKREVEEADKAYRRAIFDLETLRMRRARTLKAAAASVIDCRSELALTAQAVWTQSERSQIVMHNKGSGLHEHGAEVVKSALEGFEDELRSMEENLPSIRDVEDSRVSYVNYWHGELKNLIFGTPLTDYPLTVPYRLSDTVAPPLVVTKSIEFIETHAIDFPGIYRTSAKQSSVKQLALAIEKDELGFQFDPAKDEPAAVAGVFKDYLRQLPEPVLAIPWADRIKYTHEREEHIGTGFAILKGKIRRLPPIHQVTLKVIVQHLSKVAQHAGQNKMTAANLSVVFSPCLLSETDHETTSVAAAMEEDKTMEDLILYCNDIFDLKTAGAPLLPAISSTRGDELSRAGKSAADAAFAASEPEPPSGITTPPLLSTSATGLGSASAFIPIPSPSPVPSISDVPIVPPGAISLKRSNAITPAVAAFEAPDAAFNSRSANDQVGGSRSINLQMPGTPRSGKVTDTTISDRLQSPSTPSSTHTRINVASASPSPPQRKVSSSVAAAMAAFESKSSSPTSLPRLNTTELKGRRTKTTDVDSGAGLPKSDAMAASKKLESGMVGASPSEDGDFTKARPRIQIGDMYHAAGATSEQAAASHTLESALQPVPRSSTGLSGEEGQIYLAATSAMSPSPLSAHASGPPTSAGPLTPGRLTPSSLRSPLDTVIDSAQASHGHPTPSVEQTDPAEAVNVVTASEIDLEGSGGGAAGMQRAATS